MNVPDEVFRVAAVAGVRVWSLGLPAALSVIGTAAFVETPKWRSPVDGAHPNATTYV